MLFSTLGMGARQLQIFGRYKYSYLLLFGLAMVTLTLSGILGQRQFLTYFSPTGLGRSMSVWVLPPLFWFGLVALRLFRRGNAHPLRAIRRMTKKHRFWLGRGILLTILTVLVGRAVMTIKATIANRTTYWADPIFAEWDRILFLGNDAWLVTHAVIGRTGTIFLDRIYLLWFITTAGFLAWMLFTRDQKLQVRGLIAYLLSWLLLGNLAAMAFASVGPIYFDFFLGGDRFAALLATLHEHEDLKALRIMGFLYENVGKEEIGNGISAMPSMHVAMSYLLAIVLQSERKHVALVTGGWIFFVLILIGSVHLGWHYAVDGLFAMLGVHLIWLLSGHLVQLTSTHTRPEARLQPVSLCK